MWWIIIGAVIALIVLIVLLVMFTGKSRAIGSGLSDCEGKSGYCFGASPGCPQGTLRSSAFDCTSEDVCCLGITKKCVTTDVPSKCDDGYECTTPTSEGFSNPICTKRTNQ